MLPVSLAGVAPKALNEDRSRVAENSTPSLGLRFAIARPEDSLKLGSSIYLLYRKRRRRCERLVGRFVGNPHFQRVLPRLERLQRQQFFYRHLLRGRLLNR